MNKTSQNKLGNMIPMFLFFISIFLIFLEWYNYFKVDLNSSAAMTREDVFLLEVRLLVYSIPSIVALCLVFAKQFAHGEQVYLRAPVKGSKNQMWVEKDVILTGSELTIIDALRSNAFEMYQSDLVKVCGLPKYKVTRILNGLEHKEIVKRRRCGITNMVYLLGELQHDDGQNMINPE